MSEKIWHVEMASADKIAAAQWYSAVFGWAVEHFEEMDYIQVRSGKGQPTLAFTAVDAEQGMPAGSALVYVDTADLDGLLARAREQGGTVIMDKMEIANVGWMAIIGDPHGTRIAAMQPSYIDSGAQLRSGLLREQIGAAAQALQGLMADVTPEVAHYQPGGTANSIAATYAHVVLAVDGVVNGMLRGAAPLSMSHETGLSALPPGGENQFNWHQWGVELTVDLAALGKFAAAVFASVDDYLAHLTDDQLGGSVPTPVGELSVAQMISTVVLGNLTNHAGEISALKGIQGLKGYPV